MINTKKAPLDDVKVRQAVSYAFPYQEVIDEVYHGDALQMRGVIPHGMWGHGDEIHQYEHNLTKAEELLAESSYSDTIGEYEILAIYVSGNEVEEKSLLLWQSELDKIGIDLTVRGMTTPSMFDMARDTNPENRQHVYMLYWWPDVCSPASWLANMFYSYDTVVFQFSYYNNSEVDDLIDEGQRLAGIDKDDAERKYIDAQEIIVNDATAIFLADEMYIRAIRSELGGFVDNPAYPHVVWWYDCYLEE